MEKKPCLTDNFIGKPPMLFTLPLTNYSPELEKERDKRLFLKTQRLQKATQELREKIKKVSERHLEQVERTQQIIAFSLALTEKFYNSKNELK